MRALKCDASKGELSLEEVAVPEILNTDDVIIRVAYAGLCGTDLHIMSVGRHECFKKFHPKVRNHGEGPY